MASDPETLTQLSRLVGEPISPAATPAEVQRTLEDRLATLANGILAEAAASDDVFDSDSALEFVAARIEDFATWLSEDQRTRLTESLRGKIEAW